MNSLTPSLHANRPLSLNISGKEKMVREFGADKDFKHELEQLLAYCGFGGPFTVIVDTRIKGRPHTQGFQLGSPNLNRRSVEVRWQSGGNDTRFSLQVTVPHGMEPIEFHTRLDQALKEREAGDEHDGEVNGIALDALPEHPAQQDVMVQESIELTEVDIELFLREILPTATAAGVVTRQICVDVLTQLGRQDYDADLQALIAAKHLDVGRTKAFLCIPADWLAKLRTSSEPAERPVEVAIPQPAQQVETPPSPGNLLAEVEKLSKIVEKAQEHRTNLPNLQREVSEIEETIAQSNARLEVIRPQLAEAEAFLANPEVKQAEQMLTTLRQLVGK